LRTYGQQLSEVAELYSELQSFDDETIVRKDFRAYDYLGDVIPYLEGVIVSNSFVVSRMAELFGFPSEYMDKVHILNIPYTYKRVKDIEYAQKPGALQSERSSRSDQYTVAWLFDGSAQKGIFESVKKRMPDVEFVDLVRSKHNIFSGNDNKKYDAYLTTDSCHARGGWEGFAII